MAHASTHTFDVSYVITVYNKADILPHVIAGLLAQKSQLKSEYIFVDDASTDDSLGVLQAYQEKVPNFRVITNKTNKGPSIRINDGARAAKGYFLHLLDGDDILPPKTTETMHRLCVKHEADFLYGQVKNFDAVCEKAFKEPVADDVSVDVFDAPLEGVLQCSVRGVPIFVKRKLYARGGGADERLFVQDQSLPLRLARYAKRFIYMRTPVVYAPRCGYHLSGDLKRQHHDGFLAFYYAFYANPAMKRKIFEKMVSVLWKAYRGSLRGMLCFGWFYVFVKITKPRPIAFGFLKHCAKKKWPHMCLKIS